MNLSAHDAELIGTSLKKTAKWEQAGSSKFDYDFDTLKVSCRMYGVGYDQLSATVHILLPVQVGGEYFEIASEELFADTESEMRVKVENWVQEQHLKILKVLFANLVLPENAQNSNVLRKLRNGL